MKIERAMWLHEQHELLLEELCELSGLSETELRELVDYGVLAPIDSDAQHWTFSADRLIVARSARRLRKPTASSGVPKEPSVRVLTSTTTSSLPRRQIRSSSPRLARNPAPTTW